MRINARLDDEHMEKLEFLKNKDHLSTTDVLKQAIDVLYEQRKMQNRSKLQQLLQSDFIGCAEGPEDLSERYKDYLTEGWAEKHGLD